MGYNDFPDGQDCFNKILTVTKKTAFLGVFGATYDVLLYSKPTGYLPTLTRYVKIAGPCAAAGATFAGVVCALTNIRGKDDKVNYFLGGASAGGIFGGVNRSFRLGIPLSFLFGIAAILFKDSKDNGWEMFPSPKYRDLFPPRQS